MLLDIEMMPLFHT